MGGLLASTILTSALLPVMIVAVEDGIAAIGRALSALSRMLTRLVRRLLGRRSAASATAK
jgi:hypothetical protein